MKSVVIVQRVVPHYRLPFFDALAKRLERSGISLKLIYGQAAEGMVPKSVKVNRKWAIQIDNRYWNLGGIELVWQPALKFFKDADLVIVEQANRLLLNYLLILGRSWLDFKVAFWGHGKNFQSRKAGGFLEFWKRFNSTKVDWWFAYTSDGSQIVSSLGFDEEKITVVSNSIDTRSLISSKKAISLEDLDVCRAKLGILSGNVGIYCGGMYEEKRIPFLLQACLEVRGVVDDFTMIFIGDGPEAKLIEDFAAQYDWVHFLGALTGAQVVPYFMMSKVLLMPGLVGLVVLDSFALGVPMITTNIPFHSPEIAYLEDRVNGRIVASDLGEYSSAVVEVLQNAGLYHALVEGCSAASKVYTIENMADNFCSGIVGAISKK